MNFQEIADVVLGETSERNSGTIFSNIAQLNQQVKMYQDQTILDYQNGNVDKDRIGMVRDLTWAADFITSCLYGEPSTDTVLVIATKPCDQILKEIKDEHTIIGEHPLVFDMRMSDDPVDRPTLSAYVADLLQADDALTHPVPEAFHLGCDTIPVGFIPSEWLSDDGEVLPHIAKQFENAIKAISDENKVQPLKRTVVFVSGPSTIAFSMLLEKASRVYAELGRYFTDDNGAEQQVKSFYAEVVNGHIIVPVKTMTGSYDVKMPYAIQD